MVEDDDEYVMKFLPSVTSTPKQTSQRSAIAHDHNTSKMPRYDPETISKDLEKFAFVLKATELMITNNQLFKDSRPNILNLTYIESKPLTYVQRKLMDNICNILKTKYILPENLDTETELEKEKEKFESLKVSKICDLVGSYLEETNCPPRDLHQVTSYLMNLLLKHNPEVDTSNINLHSNLSTVLQPPEEHNIRKVRIVPRRVRIPSQYSAGEFDASIMHEVIHPSGISSIPMSYKITIILETPSLPNIIVRESPSRLNICTFFSTIWTYLQMIYNFIVDLHRNNNTTLEITIINNHHIPNLNQQGSESSAT